MKPTNFSRTYIFGAIIVGLFLFLAVASSLLTQAFLEKGTKKQTVSMQPVQNATESAQAGIYADLPESFPKDMPLVKAARVTTASEDGNQWIGVFLVPVSVGEAAAFYEKELGSSGWTITNQTKAAGLTLFYISRAKREAIVAIGTSDRGTTVSITILKSS